MAATAQQTNQQNHYSLPLEELESNGDFKQEYVCM